MYKSQVVHLYSSKGDRETCPPTPFKFSPILPVYNIDESRSHRVDMGDSYSREMKVFSRPRITPNASNLEPPCCTQETPRYKLKRLKIDR